MKLGTRELAHGSARPWPRVLEELVQRLFSPSPHATVSAPHVRAPVSVERLLCYFVIASVPTLVVGLWNLGFQTFEGMAAMEIDVSPGWRGGILAVLGLPLSRESAVACVFLGLLYFLPLLVAALAVSIFWEVVFATQRHRPVDPGWLMSSWLFVLLLPASLPLGLALLGMSFGVVLGKHIFGGTGKYIVSPPLVGVLFLYFGYPAHFVGETALVPVPSFTVSSTWAVLAEEGTASAQGVTWIQVFLGQEIGALATGSTLACLIGAVFLIYTGAASGRTLLGALGGLVITTLLFNELGSEDPAWLLPWHWQLAIGRLAFGVAFLATDPTTSPMTPAGRWIHGALIGVLTVIMRVANPAHPDGALFAILVAGLATPVIDYFVLRACLARWRKRMRA
jgi:Na+-transporting NADH:ubiquinone oxidoreductase subunit B